MTTALKAIETSYRGYRFRSRTEARWAVFLDVAGIEWTYEEEGYDLDGVWYLPDFVLKVYGGRCWMEVKPTAPTLNDAAWIKASKLSAIARGPVIVTCSQPDITVPLMLFEGGRVYRTYRWARCLRCGVVAPSMGGDGAHLTCGCFRHGIDAYPAWNDPKLLEAFGAARAERFGT